MFWALIFLSAGLIGFGLLCMMAGMMSDAPSEGNATANHGLIMLAIAVALIIFDLVARHNHWLEIISKFGNNP